MDVDDARNAEIANDIFSVLPLELEFHIFSFVNIKDLVRLDLVCRRWRQNLCEAQWKRFFKSCFGGCLTKLTWKKTFYRMYKKLGGLLFHKHTERMAPSVCLLGGAVLDVRIADYAYPDRRNAIIKRFSYAGALGCHKLISNTLRWVLESGKGERDKVTDLVTETLGRICAGTTDAVTFSIPPSFVSRFATYSVGNLRIFQPRMDVEDKERFPFMPSNSLATVVQTLLDFGAHVNHTDMMRRTPLWHATETFCKYHQERKFTANVAYFDVIEILLAHGARVDLADKVWGNTPLITAVRIGDVELIRLLLAYMSYGDPCINIADKSGYTPLMWSAYTGEGEVMELLIDFGADPHLKDVMGMKAIDWAEFTGHKQVVPLLLMAHTSTARI
jgi:hypothetical protein